MQRVEPDHLRLYLLSTHIRADANYTEGALDRLRDRYERLKEAAARAGEAEANGVVFAQILERLDDDFDVPGALDAADASAHRVLTGTGDAAEAAAVRKALQLLGFAFAGGRGPANGDFSP
jgi:cysteinyl-tRNA synthetase